MTKKFNPNLIIQSAPEWLQAGGLLSVPAMRPHADVTVNGQLMANALLRRDEWEVLDAEVLDTAKTRLVVAQDLISRGLTVNLGGLGAILSTYERVSDMDGAQIDMDGATEPEEDRVDFDTVTVPVPIIHKGFRLSKRFLEASRTRGETLDVTQVRKSTRVVAEGVEAMIVNGTGIPQVGGNVAYGLTNHPSRLTDTATNYGGGDFGTESNGYKTIKGMIKALEDIGFNGPYGAYFASDQYYELLNRHTDGSGQSELASIVQNLPNLEFIRISRDLTAATGVLFQLDKETIDLAIGQDLVTVQWNSLGGMIEYFRVMTALVPRIKADKNGNCGVAHVTAA